MRLRKNRAFAFVVGFAIAAAAGAFAAIIIYSNTFKPGSGATGTIAGVTTTLPAFELVNKQAFVPTPLKEGQSTTLEFTVKSLSDKPATIPSGLTATITSSPASCASHLKVVGIIAKPFTGGVGYDNTAWKSGGRTYAPAEWVDSAAGSGIDVTTIDALPDECTNSDATFAVVIG